MLETHVTSENVLFFEKMSKDDQDGPVRQKVNMQHEFQLLSSHTCILQPNLGQFYKFVLEAEIKDEAP